ncbi:MAG: AAA family ATPase [Clostridia bacterium]|nr:AAA family ATPase [Clostridia bacterium]
MKRRKNAVIGSGDGKTVINSESAELKELYRMRARSLSVPLSEQVRPSTMKEIIGQQDGIKALRAAICSSNPQHVIIYGPPGVGKTCAARLVLEEAKKNPISPFDENSKFVEMDSTCIRFDERSIADPLIGSVHDPIYQGAGSLGSSGVPQPKAGAVTRAHCGVLFLDEIGELHPMQMNKLLKVLEDRRVCFESAYYSKDNHNIPAHIHDIFANGLPADFRLVGATTRAPEELSPALRSRCVELFFRGLTCDELFVIAKAAAGRLNCSVTDDAAYLCAQYSASGRDAVNMIQMAGSAAINEGRRYINVCDIEWVANVCRRSRRILPKLNEIMPVGVCAGLGVASCGVGVVLEVECSVVKVQKGNGKMILDGMAEEEEIQLQSRSIKRKSTVRSSVENVRWVFLKRFNIDCRDYDVAFNVPGGIPVDGPSAGIAFAVALMSALTGRKAASLTAFTGEITPHGEIHRVGGIAEKIEAALDAGAKNVVIPKESWEDCLKKYEGGGIKIFTVSDIAEVMQMAFLNRSVEKTALEAKVNLS